jgi:hypothetical protein
MLAYEAGGTCDECVHSVPLLILKEAAFWQDPLSVIFMVLLIMSANSVLKVIIALKDENWRQFQ